MKDSTEQYSDHECRLMLRDLYDGYSVVVPTSEEHAKFMIHVAQYYIDKQQQQTFDALKREY